MRGCFAFTVWKGIGGLVWYEGRLVHGYWRVVSFEMNEIAEEWRSELDVSLHGSITCLCYAWDDGKRYN